MTPAVKYLQAHGCAFELLQYDHHGDDSNYGQQVCDKLNLNPEQVFKTLIVELDNGLLVVALVSVNDQLNLKQLAKLNKVKKAHLADADKAQRSSGYLLGGVSPFGQKRQLKTFVCETALEFEKIYVSAGKRGLELEISPQLLGCVDLCGADFVQIKGFQCTK